MINNTNLLKVAIGMGFHAQRAVSYHGDNNLQHTMVVLSSNDKLDDYIGQFNPTEGELIKWLLERGNLDLSEHEACLYIYNNGHVIKNYSSTYESDLKENLLSIALQVIENE